MNRFVKVGIGAVVVLLFAYYIIRVNYFPFSLSYEDLSQYAENTLVLDNGMQVNYRLENNDEKNTVVLIHGGGDSFVTWNDVIDSLAKKYRVLAIDMPGHGLTDPFPDKIYNQYTEADFLKKVVDRLNIDKFTLIGHSFGGHFSTQFGIENNERLNALVLIGSGGYITENSNVGLEKDLIKQLQSPLGKILRYMTNFELYKDGYASYSYDKSIDVENEVMKLYELSLYEKNRGSIMDLLVSSYSSMKNFQSEEMDKINAPVLLIWGDKDQVALPETSDMFLGDLPHARRIIYQNVGHNIHLEYKEQLIEDLGRFLMSVFE